MKKFMIAGAVVKEMAARTTKSDSDAMLTMLNSTAGSDDIDDVPTDSLAYGHMRIRKDGSVMTETDIRELRQRQGYCVTCPGDPVKLYDVKRSKINPLYQKKEPIQVANQSVNGICLKCNPANQQPVRRSTLNADMLAGTVHALNADPTFRQSRGINGSFGSSNSNGMEGTSMHRPTALGLSMMGGSSNSGGGISSGSEHSLNKPAGKSSMSRSRSPLTRRSFTRPPARLYRSNSDESMNVGRSLTPTRVAQKSDTLLRTLRRSNSDESLVPATGKAAGKLLALAPPKSAFKRSQSNGFEETPNLEGFTLTAGKNSYRRPSQLAPKPDTAPTPSKSASPKRDDTTNKVQTNGGSRDIVSDVEPKVIDPSATKSGGGQDQGSGKKLPLLDSDGFFNDINEASQFGFHNSFVNFEPERVAGMEPTLLEPARQDVEDHDSVDNSVLFRTDKSVSSTNSKKSEKNDINAASRAVEKPLIAQLSNHSLGTTASDTQIDIKFNLLQDKVVGFVGTSTDRFDAIDKQLTTLLQQQTLIIQQNATILQLLSNLTNGGSSFLGMASSNAVLSSPQQGHIPQASPVSSQSQQPSKQKQRPVRMVQDMPLTRAANTSFRSTTSSTTPSPTNGSHSDAATGNEEAHHQPRGGQQHPSPSMMLRQQVSQGKSFSGLERHMNGAHGLGDTAVDASSSYVDYEIPTNDTAVANSKTLGKRRSSHKSLTTTESRRDSKSSRDGSVKKLVSDTPEIMKGVDDTGLAGGVSAGASSWIPSNDTPVMTSNKTLVVRPRSNSKAEGRRGSQSSQESSTNEPTMVVSDATNGDNLFLIDRGGVTTDDRKDGGEKSSRRRSNSARLLQGETLSSSRHDKPERSSSQKVKKKKKEKKKSSRRVSEVSATDDDDSVRTGGSPEV